MAGSISIKRVYEKPVSSDGRRVLVDRIWPRGLTREAASIDEWLKELGPSTALRKWFGHSPARWDEFCERYRSELAGEAVAPLLRRLSDVAAKQPLTLVYSARDELHNQAVVIAGVLSDLRRR